MSAYFSIMGNLDWVMPNVLERLPKFINSIETCFGRGELVWHTNPPSGREIKNDKDPDIIRIHSWVKNATVEDLNALSEYDWTYTKARFDEIRKWENPLNDLDFIYRYIYMAESGRNDSYVVESSFFPLCEGEIYDMERIKQAKRRFKNVEFTNIDATDLVKKYDREDTFFFIDPPYPSRERYYPVHDLDWAKFYEALRGCKGKWMMCYDPRLSTHDKEIDYALKCKEVAEKIIEENPHYVCKQKYSMSHMFKKTNYPEFKTYYLVWNYEIKESTLEKW